MRKIASLVVALSLVAAFAACGKSPVTYSGAVDCKKMYPSKAGITAYQCVIGLWRPGKNPMTDSCDYTGVFGVCAPDRDTAISVGAKLAQPAVDQAVAAVPGTTVRFACVDTKQTSWAPPKANDFEPDVELVEGDDPVGEARQRDSVQDEVAAIFAKYGIEPAEECSYGDVVLAEPSSCTPVTSTPDACSSCAAEKCCEGFNKCFAGATSQNACSCRMECEQVGALDGCASCATEYGDPNDDLNVVALGACLKVHCASECPLFLNY